MKYMAAGVIALAFILFSCSLNQKQMLDNYWQDLVKAQNGDEETGVLQQLAKYLEQKQISFAIYKNINGKLTDLSNITLADSLHPVTIIFQEAGSKEEITKEGWVPKKPENVFYLYNE